MTTIRTALSLLALTASAASAQGHYANVNGLKMYYETHGTGQPLVLIHGAFSNVDTDFGRLIPALAKTHRVIAIEEQGHGRTGDVAGRPLTYEQLSDDTAELLRQLGVTSADFFGYSLGGAIALETAIRHPSLVRRFVWAGGAVYNAEGFHPGLVEGEKHLTPDMLAGTPWQKAYVRLAPQVGDWAALVDKVKALDTAWQGWTADQIRGIKVPSLLIVGDADIGRPEHVAEMFRLLGGGVAGDIVGLPRAQLAVLPGTTHVTLIDRTDWLRTMVTAFLDAKPTKPGSPAAK